MAQIERTGRVVFHDASLDIWEEDIPQNHTERNIWEKAFKHDVFKRIIQTLNRIGWTCVIPEQHIKDYSASFARNFRYCTKGDLKADLKISGRHIELNMFQNVNAPDRPDYEGRYQHNQEQHMPYMLKLEMERTRRRIRDYLCNVFTGYEFKTDRADGRTQKRGPNHLTALEWVQGCYETSWHFKGDTSAYKISDSNAKSADGALVQHQQRVWFYDYQGRIQTGIAHYNINNMWRVITGKYDCTNQASFELYTQPPENIRAKKNNRWRTQRLQRLIDNSVKAMDYERAAILRDQLYPDGIPSDLQEAA